MSLLSITVILFSYLLGAIPFGYIISKISARKNVLEIGWRKTSGSNVFKNVGKWQGILTGALDIGKGASAILLAQALGLSSFFQVICGVAAITGHNWSIFLKFSGGRGIGTFGGVFLILSPQIFGFLLISIVSLALIWDAAIGTILALVLALILSFYFNQFETAGIFALLSLVPIFIKRLSPIKELSFKKPGVIINRLIFDDDTAHFDFRIKRIIKKVDKKARLDRL